MEQVIQYMTLTERLQEHFEESESVAVRELDEVTAIYFNDVDVYIEEYFYEEWDHSEWVAKIYHRRGGVVVEIGEVDFNVLIKKLSKYLKEY